MLYHVIQEVMESPKTSRKQQAAVLFLNTYDTIAIGGRSLSHEDDSFNKVIKCMDRHLKKHTRLEFYFAFEVFDFQTLSYLFRIFKKLNRYHEIGKEVQIHWSYVRQTEMMEVGLELKNFCDFPLEIIGLGDYPVNYWFTAS